MWYQFLSSDAEIFKNLTKETSKTHVCPLYNVTVRSSPLLGFSRTTESGLELENIPVAQKENNTNWNYFKIKLLIIALRLIVKALHDFFLKKETLKSSLVGIIY